MKQLQPAIICSCHAIGLAVIRALGAKCIPIIAASYDNKDMGALSKYVKELVRLPHPISHEKDFIDALLSLGPRFRDCVLIPTEDATLTVISKQKEALQQFYRVACPAWNITEKFIDKHISYSLAETAGISAPRSRIVHNRDDILRLLPNFKFPMIFKPCKSHLYFDKFHRKMVRVYSQEELLSEFDRAEGQGIKMMLQEYIPGDDAHGVNYNSFFIEGSPVYEFTAEKVRLSPPEFGIPCVVQQKDIPEILKPGRDILKAMGFSGYSCTEFKKDPRDGIFKFMEVNGRHNRSALLALKCGINFPWIEYQLLVNGRMEPFPQEIHKKLIWIDEFKDIATYIPRIAKFKCSILSFMIPYFKPHVFAIFDKNDIKPFLKRLKDSIISIALKRFKSNTIANEK